MCLYIKFTVILTPQYHNYVSRILLFYCLSYLFWGLFNWGAISVAILVLFGETTTINQAEENNPGSTLPHQDFPKDGDQSWSCVGCSPSIGFLRHFSSEIVVVVTNYYWKVVIPSPCHSMNHYYHSFITIGKLISRHYVCWNYGGC